MNSHEFSYGQSAAASRAESGLIPRTERLEYIIQRYRAEEVVAAVRAVGCDLVEAGHIIVEARPLQVSMGVLTHEGVVARGVGQRGGIVPGGSIGKHLAEEVHCIGVAAALQNGLPRAG